LQEKFRQIYSIVGECGKLINILFPYSQPIYLENLKNLFRFFEKKGHAIQFITEGSITDLDIRPDLVLTNQAWWNIENEIGNEASSMDIPHITIEHGAPLFYQGGKQYYRKNIGSANLKLLWGNYNLYMMKKYGCPESKLRITGFPRFDNLTNIKPITNTTPRVLFLSTWKIPGQIKQIWEQTLNQVNKLNYNLAIKHHPQEHQRGYLIRKNDIPNWVEIIKNENLFEEVSKSDLIISTPTSVLIAALYFKKPIFCYYPLFMKDYWKGLLSFYTKFNFIPKPSIFSKIDIKYLLEKNINIEKYNQMLGDVANGIDGNCCQNVYNECMAII
jgi:hypothetical protein